MAAVRRLLPVLVALSCARARLEGGAGGWQAGDVPEERRCTVERADGSMSAALFLQRYGRIRAPHPPTPHPHTPSPFWSRCSLPGSPSPGPSSSAGSRITR
ncbi:UNVERIFIED_CONTAM: hypothetical protein H355_001840 [Colinus virginianus]|nr:hypothetical protein H355_001840 [Colinus virginianus]